MNTTALICTALLGLLLFGLGFAVSGLRFQQRQMNGFADDPANLLHRLVRAHGNTAEYVPFLAVLFLYFGSRSPSQAVLGLIIAATVSRVVLVVGLVAWPSISTPNPFRFVGALGTYFAGGGLCVALFTT